ncbi:hypothetical protein [Angustibacter luteus]|uniref:Uncharacterized protein n=1 Tax=Angustibacter luteus TaxID=658456 RepID=A0ABW1JAH9_9ACTN
MTVLDHLSAAPGVYWGEGQGPGGSRFVARVALIAQSDASLTFDYEAWSPGGGLQHAESARLARTGEVVTLAATSNGGDDVMLFREGDAGVFGSVGPQRVGLVITPQEQKLVFSWWWTGRDGELREQSRAVVAPMRQIVPAPAVPGADAPESAAGTTEDPQAATAAPEEVEPEELSGLDQLAALAHEALEELDDEPQARVPDEGEPADELATSDEAERAEEPESSDQAELSDEVNEAESEPQPEQPGDLPAVPWPGILVLHGNGTGLVAQRLASRLTRAAVVRTDLFDRAVRGTAGRPDPALRQRIALSVVQGYAATGHPVILHGASTRSEHEELVAAISGSGLKPVQLVEIADGEDYGEVARRLIESD